MCLLPPYTPLHFVFYKQLIMQLGLFINGFTYKKLRDVGLFEFFRVCLVRASPHLYTVFDGKGLKSLII